MLLILPSSFPVRRDRAMDPEKAAGSHLEGRGVTWARIG